MHQRFLTCLSVSIAAAFGSGSVSALGFGRSVPSAMLGAPLDFSVGLRLEAGEAMTETCVSSEVVSGDVTLPRGAVFTNLEPGTGGPTVRVRTSVRIEEPVLTVTVTAGCETKVSRKFTLFADPPGLATGMPAVLPPEPAVAASPASSPPLTAPLAAAATPSRAVAGTAPSAPRKRAPAPRSVAKAPVDDAVPAPARKVKASALPSVQAQRAQAQSAARLRLDAPSVTYAADQAAEAAFLQREELLAAVRAAANVAEVAASSASSRVSAMEASVEALKRESNAQRDAMKRLQASLAEADQRSQWTPWLLAAVLALLAAAGWLYARLRRAEAARQANWWTPPDAAASEAANVAAEPAPAASQEPAVTAEPAVAEAAPAPAPSLPPLPPVVTPNVGSGLEAERRPGTMTQHTQPLPAGFVVPDAAPARDVSIEELLDIEQQAEFFIVLGQDDAAVDLLMGHLRSTGGSSPLPYLKLLEIYHRRGDQTAYERIRMRFNDRFNAVAPEWSSDLNAGRSLVDYPELIEQIERSWPRPVDAMADLETLLFRTDGRELFDLPAYRDVLFLFTLARDVQESLQHEAPQVDVLLPLFRVDPPEPAAPSPVPAVEASMPGELRLTLVERAEPTPVAAPAAVGADSASEFGLLKNGPAARP